MLRGRMQDRPGIPRRGAAAIVFAIAMIGMSATGAGCSVLLAPGDNPQKCGTDADCPGGGTCQRQRILYEYMGLASAYTEAHPLWTDCRTGCDSASTPTAQQFTATISQLKK